MSDVSNPEVSIFSGLEVPVLTEEQVQALFDAPNHGVTQPEGIPSYPTFKDDWIAKGGLQATDNFYRYFCSDYFGQQLRDNSEHFIRYEFLYPKELELMKLLADKLQSRGGPDSNVSESVQYMFWQAYEKLHSLVDVNDRGVRRVPNFKTSTDAKRYLTR